MTRWNCLCIRLTAWVWLGCFAGCPDPRPEPVTDDPMSGVATEKEGMQSEKPVTRTKAIAIASSHLRKKGWLYEKYEVKAIPSDGGWEVRFVGLPRTPDMFTTVTVDASGSVTGVQAAP